MKASGEAAKAGHGDCCRSKMGHKEGTHGAVKMAEGVSCPMKGGDAQAMHAGMKHEASADEKSCCGCACCGAKKSETVAEVLQ